LLYIRAREARQRKEAEMIKATIYKTLDLGLSIEDGGKFTAVCEEHNTLVQGTRTSLQGRFTFEFCEFCEYPRKEGK